MNMNEQTPTFWVTYYSDFSGIAIFETEVSALRYAVGRGMFVHAVAEGIDLRELLS